MLQMTDMVQLGSIPAPIQFFLSPFNDLTNQPRWLICAIAKDAKLYAKQNDQIQSLKKYASAFG